MLHAPDIKPRPFYWRHGLIKALNVPLGWIGAKLTRVSKHDVTSPDRYDHVPVGRFELAAPPDSPLTHWYRVNPMYSGELGRIVRYIIERYPDAYLADIGANIGDTAAIMRTSVAAPIVCIEGDAKAFAYLEKNIKQLHDVTAMCLLLNDRDERLSVKVEKEGINMTLVPSTDADARGVGMRSLDALLGEMPSIARQLKFIKIDTEGFDTRILRGARETLKRNRPVLYFEYNRENMFHINEDGLSTLRMLHELGYESACFFESTGRFVLSASLGDEKTIRDLHEYADGYRASIYYFDVCAFHRDDEQMAAAFADAEREIRRSESGPRGPAA